MNNLIAKFSYNNKKYEITSGLKNKINYFIYDEKGHLSEDIEKEDIHLLNTVFNSLKVDINRSTYNGKIEVNNNLYDLFYDIKTKNYFWLLLNGSETESDNVFLNFRFNHVPIVWHFDYKNKINKSQFYNKFVKFGKKLIAVSITSIIALTSLTGCTLGKVNHSSFNYSSEDYNYTEFLEDKPAAQDDSDIKEYSWDEIKAAIEGNPNLGNDEKEFLYKLQFVFDENHEYIENEYSAYFFWNYNEQPKYNLIQKYKGLEDLIDKFKTLKINYCDYSKESTSSPYGSIAGEYHCETNEIYFYNVKSFNDVSLNVFLHEVGHMFQPMSRYSFLTELSNEFFTRETLMRLNYYGLIPPTDIDHPCFFYSENGNGYSLEMHLYYALARLIPSESLRNFQFSGNDTLLVKNLAELITKCKQDSNEHDGTLYDYTEEARLLLGTIGCLNTLEDGDEYVEKLDLCHERLNNFYRTVYGMNIEEDLRIAILISPYSMFSNNNIVQEAKNEYLSGSSAYKDGCKITPKSYFSDVNPYTVIAYAEEPVLIKEFGDIKINTVPMAYMNIYDEKDYSLYQEIYNQHLNEKSKSK